MSTTNKTKQVNQNSNNKLLRIIIIGRTKSTKTNTQQNYTKTIRSATKTTKQTNNETTAQKHTKNTQ